MERKQVDSSTIKSVGYDSQSHILEVEFKRKGNPQQIGAVYQYDGVPYSHFDGLMRAESKGRYFALFIKSDFKFKKVEADGKEESY